MKRIDTITLWLDEESVIVESGSSADRLFRSKGYTVEQKIKTAIPRRKYTKKVKAGGD